LNHNKIRKPGIFNKYKGNDHELTIFAIPGVIFLVLFCYLPMIGLILVFKDYNFKGGIFNSPWATPILRNFSFFFHNIDKAIRSTRNTIVLNLLYFLIGTLFAVSIAIMLSELKNKYFVKLTQSVMFFPFFISWMVFGSILATILDYRIGALNGVIRFFGGQAIDFYSKPFYWIAILVLSNTWNSAGYSSIIYYATLSGIDPSYYEAAVVDGASKWKQIRYISLPLLRPTIIMLFLLALGNMLKGNLQMIMGLTNLNPLLLPVTDIIDVYVYRSGVKTGEIAFSSAISLYQSIFGFILVFFSNSLVRRLDPESALF